MQLKVSEETHATTSSMHDGNHFLRRIIGLRFNPRDAMEWSTGFDFDGVDSFACDGSMIRMMAWSLPGLSNDCCSLPSLVFRCNNFLWRVCFCRARRTIRSRSRRCFSSVYWSEICFALARISNDWLSFASAKAVSMATPLYAGSGVDNDVDEVIIWSWKYFHNWSKAFDSTPPSTCKHN